MLHEQTITDLNLVCMDGELATSRVVLALAYPTLALSLKGRDEENLLLLLPSFRVQEVQERIHGLLSGNLHLEEVGNLRKYLILLAPGYRALAERCHFPNKPPFFRWLLLINCM